MCHCIFFGINPRVSKYHAFRFHRATETSVERVMTELQNILIKLVDTEIIQMKPK